MANTSIKITADSPIARISLDNLHSVTDEIKSMLFKVLGSEASIEIKVTTEFTKSAEVRYVNNY